MQTCSACLLAVALAILPALTAVGGQAPAGPGQELPPGLIRTLASPPSFYHHGAVTDLVVTNGGKGILTGNFSGGAVLWDVETGKGVRKFASAVYTHLALAPREDLLAVRTGDRTITVFEVASGKVGFTVKAEDANAMAFAPDSATLATGSGKEHEIRLWKTATGEAAGTFEGHQRAVARLAFHPDGKSLFSISLDGTLRQWDVATGKELWRLTEKHGWFGYALAVSGDGKTLALECGTGSGSLPGNFLGHVRLFDIGTQTERFRAALPVGRAHEVAVSHDGRFVAIAFARARPQDGPIRLWDSWTCKQILVDPGNVQPTYRLQFLPDCKTFASAGNDGVVRMWNVADGAERPAAKRLGSLVQTELLAFAPSGEMLASLDSSGSVILWDTLKGVPLRSLERATAPVGTLIFSLDSTFLVSTPPGTVYKGSGVVWHVPSGKIVRTFPAYLEAVALAPDGKTMAVSEDRITVVLRDIAKGTEIGRFKDTGGTIGAFAFSPDGRLLAQANYNKNVFLWSLASRTRVKIPPLNLQDMPDRIWFSSDGLLLFVAYRIAGLVEVFDTTTSEPVLRINTPFRHCWLAQSGTTLITAQPPDKFRAFDLASGAPLGPPIAYGSGFSAWAATGDGHMLALGNQEGWLALWQAPPLPQRKLPAAEIDQAKARTLYQALAGANATVAYQARLALIDSPKQSLTFFHEVLRPAQPVDTKQIGSWIAKLDSANFKERETATSQLEKAGDAAEPSLRIVLEQEVTLEVRQRVELLLTKLAVPPSGATLQGLRAIAVLESIGGDEARAILSRLADGAPDARITEAAQAALKRM